MTRYTGNVVPYGSGASWYVYVDITDAGSNTGTTTTVTRTYGVHFDGTIYSTVNTIHWADYAASGDPNNTSFTSPGDHTVASPGAMLAPIQYGGGNTVEFILSATNIAGTGPSSLDIHYPLPARTPTVPSAPAAPSVSAVTSSSATVSMVLPASNGSALWDTSCSLFLASTGGTAVANDTSGADTSTAFGFSGLSPATTYYAEVSARNGVGWSPGSPRTPFTTAVAAPAAPTGAAAARTSDTSHTVTWTRNATSVAPYDSQQVQRSTDGGTWATIAASISGSATSYSDTTTSADHSYAWRVVAVNVSGSATSAASATLYTTPAPTGTPSAAKSGADIALTFTNAARFDTGVKIYHSAAGGAFTLLATVAAANRTTYTHTAPSTTQTHAYKVSAYNGSLESAQSASSNTVQLAAPPNAPTGLGPSGVVDAVLPVTLTWTHNPVDASPQSKYQIQYRVQGSGTWTVATAVTSSVSHATITPATSWSMVNGTTIEWQVMTWGQYATGSPWSATSTLTLSTTPTVAISSPADGGTLTTSAVTPAWTYYDAEGTAQAAWSADLLDSTGVVVEHRAGTGTAASVAMGTNLPNGSSWSVRVKVQDGSGLWSTPDTSTFTVAYALPPVPNIAPTWDPATATVALWIDNPDPGVGEVAAVSNDVYRSIDGAAPVLIATGVPTSTTITDYAPTVAGTNTYTVTATSALPSTVTCAPADVVTSTLSVWISGGPGFSQACNALYDAKTAVSGSLVKVLQQFAGRTMPVEFAGVATTRDLSLTAIIPPTPGPVSSAEDWLALAELPGPHLWRDYTGAYVTVSLPGVDFSRDTVGIVSLSLKATRIDHA